jgi:folate-binding protein YgfZ
MDEAQLRATLLGKGPYARDDAPYRLLEVAGTDAGEFLQRLCSQDVQGLAEGRVAPAAFLSAKGKVEATCLVFRLGGSFFLETQSDQADRLAGLLDRYHFTEKLSVVRGDDGPRRECIQVGPSDRQIARVLHDDPFERGRLSVLFQRRSVLFARSYGGSLQHFVALEDGGKKNVEPQQLPEDLAECLRMCAGLVRVGVETEPSTLALEADLDDHCSTTKGCYTGQEIVARIHTYGKVNRKLCLLVLPDGPAITAPEPLHEPDDDVPVGRVMHAVPAPGHGLRVGLGYLPKDFQAVGTKLKLGGGDVVEVVGFQVSAGDLPA